MFFCAISGSPPTAPVVSKTSGTVYEKALIERYIEENGTDPITGEALTKDDLIDVKAKPSTLPPRPASQTSIPALLTSLQSEYDAIMLESLQIKKEFQSSRQELANALYREDAATRVIARLLKERDSAREALSQIQASVGVVPQAQDAAGGDVEMEAESALPQAVVSVITETHDSLSEQRRKRKAPAGYAKPEDVKSYTQVNHIPSLHNTKPPGITALDVASDGNTVVTGGADKSVQIFDIAESKVVATLKGHTKPVTHVEFVDSNLAVSSSADKTVRLWGETDGKWSAKHNFNNHKGDITGLAVHPSKAFVAAASSDSTWSLYDIAEAKEVHNYQPIEGDEGSFAFSSFAIHPDGYLCGGGVQSGVVRVWDVRDPSRLAAHIESHSSPVTSLSFSENGYYLATASNTDPTVNVIDLRKLEKDNYITSWKLPEENVVSHVKFDESAQFLSVAGTDLRVYKNKTFDELLKFDDNAAVLTGAKFVKLGSEIVVGGMDRTLRVLGQKA